MYHIAIQVKKEVAESGFCCEFLRYAGVISTTAGGHNIHAPMLVTQQFGSDPGQCVVVIHEPKGVSGKVWADMNAKRIRSFGVDAIIFKD